MGKWLNLAAEQNNDEKPVTEVKAGLSKHEKKCCFWCYRFNQDLQGFTQMGLMTNDIEEAGKQLTKIYGHPVEGLHKKENTR